MSPTRNHPKLTTPVGHRLVATALAGAMLLTACGSSGDTADDESATPSVEVTATPATEQTIAEPPATEPPASDPRVTDPPTTSVADQPEPTEPPRADSTAVTVTKNVVYMTTNGEQYTMDIYTPAGEGPWPVVLNYSFGSTLEYHPRTVSETAAENGFLVYTPFWIGNQSTFTPDLFDAWKDRASCSVAFAQEHAAMNGGDTAKTVLHGFSAGVGPVMFGSQQPRTGPIDGCATSASPTPPVGVILSDGPYFLHGQDFDTSFASDPAAMQEEVALLTDPANWPTDLDAKFFLWIPEFDTAPRPIDDGSEWLPGRDRDGSIQADLDELGMLDDRWISNRDAARLFEKRLTDAGLEVTLEEFPGRHTLAEKALDLVGYMQSAVAG
jgi:dienelactone hydrolase